MPVAYGWASQPAMSTPAAFLDRLNAIAHLSEDGLARRMTQWPDVPARLKDAVSHGSLGGGKRLRPFLVAETAALFGVTAERALPAALALECIHCYSLVHDDLPAMDDDALRRGRPTVHIAYDEATAILAGDALLTFAFEILAGEETDTDPAVRCALVAALARTSGAAGMVGGQLLDLAAEGRYADDAKPLALPLDDILHLQAMKTGALFRFAVEAGGRLGRASASELAALDAYARLFGQAFQVADDLLDAEGDAATVGKATGKDAEAGKATLVGILGIAGARARLDDLVSRAKTALDPFGTRADILRAGVDFVAARQS